MMVNQIKDNSGPWPSDVPQQMPWMSSYQPTLCNLQFGQHTDLNPMLGQPTHSANHDYPLSQQQHPSIASFPTATTLTQPVTACPTSILANPMCPAIYNRTSHNVTTTTQSSAFHNNIRLTDQAPSAATTLKTSGLNVCPQLSQNYLTFNPLNSLTHLPAMEVVGKHHKRSSVEMEDSQIKIDEPPTKQLLSERKLFKQFGSLQLNGALEGVITDEGNESESSDEDEKTDSISRDSSREELNRYVYLLFKDKKSGNAQFPTANSTMDRLAREERDKLSKAVILWNPPMRNQFLNTVEENDSDEEDIKYKDHRDFLKERKKVDGDSIVITEIKSTDLPSNQALSGEDNMMMD